MQGTGGFTKRKWVAFSMLIGASGKLVESDLLGALVKFKEKKVSSRGRGFMYRFYYKPYFQLFEPLSTHFAAQKTQTKGLQ